MSTQGQEVLTGASTCRDLCGAAGDRADPHPPWPSGAQAAAARGPIAAQTNLEDREFKRCFSGPRLSCVGQRRPVGQRSESAAARFSGAEVAATVHQRDRLRVDPQNQGAFACLRKPRAQPTPSSRGAGTIGRRPLSRDQAACASWRSRAGVRGGARACNPRCMRIRSITADSAMAAMIFSSPPQFGQCSRSI